jgi:tRNA(Ile2) C34 agmatinyltransferase TiaS
MFSFYLGNCSACGRYTMLQGRKHKRCYDCKTCGYTYKTKNIPWRVVKEDELKTE